MAELIPTEQTDQFLKRIFASKMVQPSGFEFPIKGTARYTATYPDGKKVPDYNFQHFRGNSRLFSEYIGTFDRDERAQARQQLSRDLESIFMPHMAHKIRTGEINTMQQVGQYLDQQAEQMPEKNYLQRLHDARELCKASIERL